jgi:hypothetical protein
MHVYTGESNGNGNGNGSEPTTPRTPQSSNSARFDDLASPSGTLFLPQLAIDDYTDVIVVGGDGLQFQLSPIGNGRGGGRTVSRTNGALRSSNSTDSNLNRLKQFSFENSLAAAAASQQQQQHSKSKPPVPLAVVVGKNGIGASALVHAAMGGMARPPLHGAMGGGGGHMGLMDNGWNEVDAAPLDGLIPSLTISRTTSGGNGMNGHRIGAVPSTRSPIRERKTRGVGGGTPTPPPSVANPATGDRGAAAFAIPCGNDGVHEGISCSSCMAMPIVGPRFRCVICVNFQLCSSV